MMGMTIDFQLSSRGNFNPIYLLARKNLTARILALLDLVGKVYSKIVFHYLLELHLCLHEYFKESIHRYWNY